MKINKIKFYVFEHGKQYVPKVLKNFPPQKFARCFDNCILLAMRSNLRYVEGVARYNNGPWIYHAWLTDGENAFDPTWHAYDKDQNEVELPVTYIGIEMDTRLVVEFMKKTEYQGVLLNQWRAPAIARKLTPKQ